MRKGIQLAYPFEEKRLAKWKPPYIVQPKYDGERCRAVPFENGRYMLLSSQENPFFYLNHISNSLRETGLDLEFDGELYCHGMSFEQIHSIVSRTVNPHPDYEEIKFHIFDYVSDEPQFKRIAELTRLEKFSDHLVVSPFWICNTLEEIMSAYDYILYKGYEGIIVRHMQAPYLRKRSVYMMKFKPKKEDTYLITGWKEEISKDGVPKDRLGALVCCGDDGTEFSVGSGMDDEEREGLWWDREELKGKYCKIQYQHLTSGKGVPRFPVFVEVIENDSCNWCYR